MPKNSSSLSLSKLFISKKASVYRESIIFKCCERSFASASSEEASRASLFYIPDEKPQPPLTPKFASHANKDDNDVKSGSLGSVHKYIIRRTRLGKQLPLYTEFKSGRTRILTIIRKIEGDFQALYDDLIKVLPPKTPVTIRSDLGQVHVKGRFARELAEFFTNKGF